MKIINQIKKKKQKKHSCERKKKKNFDYLSHQREKKDISAHTNVMFGYLFRFLTRLSNT